MDNNAYALGTLYGYSHIIVLYNVMSLHFAWCCHMKHASVSLPLQGYNVTDMLSLWYCIPSMHMYV